MSIQRWTLVVSIALSLSSTAVAGPVAITEIMYNPAGDDGFRRLDRNTEWIELFSAASEPVSLQGWQLFKISRTGRERLLGTITSPVSIEPWATVVLVPDGMATPADFRSAWAIPDHVPVVAVAGWSGRSTMGLPNSGATVALVDAAGRLVDSVNYRGPGFPRTRNGYSIEWVAVDIPPDQLSTANDIGTGWQLSKTPIPFPGEYSGVRFDGRDRGTPGEPQVRPTPAPSTCLLLALGLPWLSRRRSP